MLKDDNYFMNFAIKEAIKAYELGEVPVGAVIVYNNEIIAKGYNTKECSVNATKHAEIIAIAEASIFFNSWRLSGCTLYVTMSPCLMCIGAINESKISRVVCGFISKNEHLFLLNTNKFTSGIQREKCLFLMQNFFKNLRNN